MQTTPWLVTGLKGARQQGQASEGPSAGWPHCGEGEGGEGPGYLQHTLPQCVCNELRTKMVQLMIRNTMEHFPRYLTFALAS
eukprot:483561-Pleurochrysis_carterae.AAC.1